MDPREALERLASSVEGLLLFGVRHHSPACSHAIGAVLDAFGPSRVLIELPADYAPWIEWLAHPDLVAPVALAGVLEDGADLSFYPFADFSPELAAMRWARARGVPIEPIDLPLARRRAIPPEPPVERDDRAWVLLNEAFDTPRGEHLWDHVVEASAPGAEPERIRRAGLAVGWALRSAEARVSHYDRAREAFMRERIAAARGEKIAVVVGAFHAPALIDPPMMWEPPTEPIAASEARFVTSLIPYAFELLDARSGYPAGIADPAWQQRLLTALAEGPAAVERELAEAIVAIARAVRGRGHVAGIPDAKEAARVAGDLARLRGLPAPSRRELLEAIESALARGELLGRGRVLARACEEVLVGRRRGQLAPSTPRSGLGPHVEAELAALRLPGRDAAKDEPARLRLDPLRSELDRARHVALSRLAACGIPYARAIEGEAAGGTETLTRVWEVRWEPATAAMIELAGLRGVTLRQAARGALRAERDRLVKDELFTARMRVGLLRAAAECGLNEVVDEDLRALVGPFLDEAGLPELLDALSLLERIRRGHVPALASYVIPGEVDRGALVAAGVRALEGLEGSDRIEDARAMLELVRLFEADPTLGDARLGWTIDRLARDGAPLISGAAHALRVILGRAPAEALGEQLGGWLDGAVDGSSRRALSLRIAGVLTAAAPLLEAHPDAMRELLARVEALSDADFLSRVSALRKGFDALSPAARGRMLAVLAERVEALDPTGRGMDVFVDADPAILAAYARADQAGREALERG